MIIDDAASVRQIVGLSLKNAGYEILEASDGQSALDFIDKNRDRGIDLFICDVNMPRMGGIDFISKLKSDVKFLDYKYTPSLMLTTESGSNMKEKGKQIGAKAWMVKPVKTEQLLEAVKKLIE